MLRTLAALAAAAALTVTSTTGAMAYVPATQTQFTVPAAAPGSTEPQQRVFLDTVAALLDATPAGETVTISMYSNSDPAATDAMIRAHQRKVRVRYLTWDQNPDGIQHQRLRSALGTNVRAPSWFKMCRGSCAFGGRAGAQHAKLVLSSRIVDANGRSVRAVTLLSSGNLTRGGSRTQWNEFQTIIDPQIYAAARSYILSLRSDRTRYDVPSATSISGKYRLTFFPRKNLPIDPVLNTLRATSCQGGGKIRVAMHLWTYPRVALARRLVALRSAGCDVAVMYNSEHTTPSVAAVLRKGRVPIYDTRVGSAETGMYVHTKTTIISAPVRGKRRNYVFAGSPNFSWVARHQNSESLLQIRSKAETDLHFRWWDAVRAATTAARS